MITVTDHGPVREIRLNRPPVNALHTELMTALRGAVESAASEGARAIVLSGSVGMFTAGLDVPLLLGLDRDGVARLWREMYALLKALATSPVPICAAITGHAPAGGSVLAMFCDYRVAARGDFKLGLTEVQVGIPLPPVIFRALTRQVGPRQAERLAVAGIFLSPEEALRVGFVDELVAPEEVVSRSLAWCESLLALPPEAMLRTRKMARVDWAQLFQGSFEDELQIVLQGWWSDETQKMLHALVARMKAK